MPLYDYRCTACDREVEVMHGINEQGPQTCEHCGGAMRKALSPPAIHFKGSGWAKKDAASASKSKPKSSTSTEKTSATSTEKATGDGAKTSTGSTASSETKSTAASSTGSKTD